jgi:hypothetical protein
MFSAFVLNEGNGLARGSRDPQPLEALSLGPSYLGGNNIRLCRESLVHAGHLSEGARRRGACRPFPLSSACGQIGRLVLRDGRLSPQLHVEAAFLVATVGLDRDLVADLLAHDRLAEVLCL